MKSAYDIIKKPVLTEKSYADMADKKYTFQVAIIPYTMEHTNFCDIQVGTRVNLEFDILGKYIARLQQLQ